MFATSVIVISFGYGVAVGSYELFPYDWMRFASGSLLRIVQNRRLLLGLRPEYHLEPARYEGSSVTRNLRDQVAPGYTLLAGFFEDGNEVRLIRSDGLIVNRWPVAFYDIFESVDYLPPEYVPQTDWNAVISSVVALPNGSVVFNFDPGGMVKMDRCRSVEWILRRNTHHSLEVAEDGGFWTPSRRWVEDDSLAPLRPPFAEDTLLKVSADGDILREISVPEILLKNGYRSELFVRSSDMVFPNNDITHLNDVEELGAELAGSFPGFAAGDLLISLRELNLIFVLDPGGEIIKWHQTGPWFGQHDPDFLPSGWISVFSNNNDGTANGSILGGSTIFEVHPPDGECQRV